VPCASKSKAASADTYLMSGPQCESSVAAGGSELTLSTICKRLKSKADCE
jgi:hypothetical protein